MGYADLAAAVRDLERTRQLVRVAAPVDPHLEAAEIQRRLYALGCPAVLFENATGSPFPMLANLFGTVDRARFLFRDAIPRVRKLVQLKADPDAALKRPWQFWDLPAALWHAKPQRVHRGPVNRLRTTLRQLPQLKCWPNDGGPFVTLPLVYTEDPRKPGWAKSNLGMYRVQFGGNDFVPDRECGLHYQIHRGIGVHHAAARDRGERLAVNVAVGGPPSLTVAAVMPLPEGMPELAFAGALGGRRIRITSAANGLAMPADADFVISGWIDPTRTKPEGPFGDHLGYYSLTHDFPVMTVEAVHHKPGAIWPFTVVGRPPQEDSTFGEFIHDLTGPAIPAVLPGVKAVHAVDAAGVHPLLLAIGSERYVPYAAERKPQELLTQANAILGQGQLSLAKYLFLVAHEDDPQLDIHDIAAFLKHLLERFDPAADLHFQTRTTIDTLDYSAGMGLNAGSKLVIAAAGPKKRELAATVPGELRLPDGFTEVRVVLPGILAVRGPKFARPEGAEYDPAVRRFADQFHPPAGFPFVVIADDAAFTAATLNNFVWVTFTRSDPASDVFGVRERVHRKHWACDAVVIDARIKPHHAPPLVEDPAVSAKVDAMFAKSGPLAGLSGTAAAGPR